MTTTAELFADRATVILWEPQDPINVGSVVRACMLCDVRELRLVNPGFADFDRVLISAPGGGAYWTEQTRVMSSWVEAVEGLQHVVAFTARGRYERQQRGRLDETLDLLAEKSGMFGLVFGREDSGLPNAIVDRCDQYVTLESSEAFSSFNLAQAVMVAVFGGFVRMGAAAAMKGPARKFERASHDALERMLGQGEASLERVGFFKGDQRENVMRTLRRVLLRAEVDEQELATFWAVFAEVGRLGRLVDEIQGGR